LGSFKERVRATLALLAGVAKGCCIISNRRIRVPLVHVIIVLIAVGVLLWLVNSYIPMAGSIKGILNAVVVIAMVIWLLEAFGLMESLKSIKIGKWPRARPGTLWGITELPEHEADGGERDSGEISPDFSQAKVRSTTQRRGRASQAMVLFERLIISVLSCDKPSPTPFKTMALDSRHRQKAFWG
jgi:hypothetical protein